MQVGKHAGKLTSMMRPQRCVGISSPGLGHLDAGRACSPRDQPVLRDRAAPLAPWRHSRALAQRHREGCPASPAVREMPMRTTVRCHFTPGRTAMITKLTNHKCSQGCGEKGTPVHCWWDCRRAQPLWETGGSFLRKLKMELPFHPAVPLLGMYPKNPEKNLCTPMFIAAQFTIAKCWKQPRCPSVNEWIKKLWHIYTMEYCSAERKELLPYSTAWMDLESIMLSETSQALKDKYHMISPLIGT
ncbi:hypothetical protein HJG60_011773 [Phyllostomus discolor]|uniref:DUF1725 domain-containing protein n=1 Tax=Phyllostomus discolor TaxID=89673 RepID=A0A833ZL31_9CHIR|nr:hypothetical protein HJG60_011773 [Phyllostomus discolor]